MTMGSILGTRHPINFLSTRQHQINNVKSYTKERAIYKLSLGLEINNLGRITEKIQTRILWT